MHVLNGILTARALVEVEEASSQANGTSQSHGLGHASLADMGRSELLEGEESCGTEGGSYGSVEIVRRPGIANNSLKVTLGVDC